MSDHPVSAPLTLGELHDLLQFALLHQSPTMPSNILTVKVTQGHLDKEIRRLEFITMSDPIIEAPAEATIPTTLATSTVTLPTT